MAVQALRRHVPNRERGLGQLVQGLGWLSVGLGVTQLLAPTLGRAHPRRSRALAATLLAVAGVMVLGIHAARRPARQRHAAVGAGEGAAPIDCSLAVDRSPQECYALWRDVERMPRFMRHLDSVRAVSATRSHWVARLPTGKTLEWDSEIVSDVPGKLIAWRALPGSEVESSGWVRFEPAPAGRGTIVRVRMRYWPSGGVAGAAVAALAGHSPQRLVQEDLRHFRQFLEAGEIPTTRGQTHGRRSLLVRALPEGRGS